MTDKETVKRILIALLRHEKYADMGVETLVSYAVGMAQEINKLTGSSEEKEDQGYHIGDYR